MQVGSLSLPLFGGTPTPGSLVLSEEQRKGIVQLTSGPLLAGSLCTGTLIDHHAVLTAKHCRVGDQMTVRFGDADDEAALQLMASSWREHPALDLLLVWLPDSTALDKLQRVPFALRKVALGETSVGSCVQQCGYGVTEDGSVGRLLFATGSVRAVLDTDLSVESATGTGPCMSVIADSAAMSRTLIDGNGA